MLEVTVVLEWLVGKPLEAYIIVGFLVFNAVVSFLQEEKANNDLSSLNEN